MIIFCKWCNHKAIETCYLCGSYYCSHHGHAKLSQADRKIVKTIFKLRDFDDLHCFMEIILVLQGLYGLHHLDSWPPFFHLDETETFRHFYERVFHKVGPFQIDISRNVCNDCSPKYVPAQITEIKAYLNSSPLQDAKEARLICAADLCIIDVDGKLTCKSCGKSFCRYHSLKCNICIETFCGTAEGGYRKFDGSIKVKAISGCALKHSHWLTSRENWIVR